MGASFAHVSPGPGCGDKGELRRALGQFPTGVALVTASDAEGNPVGVLVNSFTSLSLDPPLVLWCLAASSRSAQVLRSASSFAVNLLAADQRQMLELASRPPQQRFDGVTHVRGAAGAPLIEGAAAQFECETISIHPGGDHSIIVGRICRYRRRDAEPLAFLAGRYGRFHENHR
jgi:flavin reductase (DIM6/NTAB) family NADH-FMN oxidoreductase RutF